MTDKILTEAYNRLKAIEESDDPFCIGELSENVEEDEDVIEEADGDFPSDDEERETSNDMHGTDPAGEEPNARAEDRFFEMEDESGNNYRVSFSADGPNSPDRAFIEVNGITVATYTVGGAGAMNATIKDPEEVLNMLTSAIKAADGTGL